MGLAVAGLTAGAVPASYGCIGTAPLLLPTCPGAVHALYGCIVAALLRGGLDQEWLW